MMTVDWKKQVEGLVIGEEQIGIAELRNNVSLLFGRREIPREYENSFNNFFQQNRRESLMEILDYCSSVEYDTRLFPTIIGRRSGPNLWMNGERDKPSIEESWKAIYLLLTSININNILINIDNLSIEGRNAWRTELQSEDPLQFHLTITNELNIHSRFTNWSPSFIALLVISYFVYRVRGQIGESEWGGERFAEILQREYSFTDYTTLIVFNDLLGRRKKEVNYFSKLVSFINRWFGDYVAGKDNRISLLAFLDSVASTSSSRENLRMLSNVREKFVFELLKYGKINGLLLNKLIVMRLRGDLKTKQFQIAAARGLYKIL
jgi:hypothetical protein